MNKPICTKENCSECFASTKQRNGSYRCGILTEMTKGSGCAFFKTRKQYTEDANLYAPKKK